MTEYWKSNPRFCCPVCNVWMADNHASRRKHEQGNKHIFAVQEMIRKKRDQKFQFERENRELKRELKNIEMVAAAAHVNDAEHFSRAMTGVSAAAEKSGAHYFPQFFPQKIDNIRPLGFDGDSSKKEMENDKKGEVEEEEVEDGSSGTYEIDGCWYLDGKTCEDRLKDGTLCELFHEGGVNEEEGTDEWFPAKIVSSRVIIVPHANTSFKRFTVEYGKDFSKTEKDVGSDRLRLIIDENEAKEQEMKELAASKVTLKRPPTPPPPVDENTGIGGWQTVSVREVDLQAEERERSEKERMKAAKAAEKAAKAEREEHIAAAMNADDAMGSYDPYGTDTYRGVKIENRDGRPQTMAVYDAQLYMHGESSNSKPVAFKKRKKTRNEVKKRRDRPENE